MESREQTLVAMKKLVYFPHNYGTYNAIDEIWKGNESLREHMQEKFAEAQYDFFEFFLELDAANQRLVLEFVLDNYDGIRGV